MSEIIVEPTQTVPAQALVWGLENSTAKYVDTTQPLPTTQTGTVDVESAAPSSTTVTISNGTSLSAALDLGSQRIHRIVIPSAWTAAGLTFQASYDGTNYNDLYDANGEVTLTSTVVAASRGILFDQATSHGIRYIKIRSGSGASPVTQGADRVITLATVAR